MIFEKFSSSDVCVSLAIRFRINNGELKTVPNCLGKEKPFLSSSRNHVSDTHMKHKTLFSQLKMALLSINLNVFLMMESRIALD